MCVCVRACQCACVRACVCVRVRACVLPRFCTPTSFVPPIKAACRVEWTAEAASRFVQSVTVVVQALGRAEHCRCSVTACGSAVVLKLSARTVIVSYTTILASALITLIWICTMFVVSL